MVVHIGLSRLKSTDIGHAVKSTIITYGWLAEDDLGVVSGNSPSHWANDSESESA
jgi:hypothetical protein